MRHCRICNRNYNDDDTFCAADGSMLAMGAAPVPVHDRPNAPSTPEAPRARSAPGSEEKPSSETGGQNSGVVSKK